MKKIFTFLLLPLFFLSSCKKDEKNYKIDILKIKENNIQVNNNKVTFFYDLTSDDILNIKENKQDLFFYVNSPSCTATCGTFLTSLEMFVSSNNLLLPFIEIGNFHNTDIEKERISSSQFVIIKKGEIVLQEKIDENTNYNFIIEFFNKYINIKNTYISNDLFLDDKQITYKSAVHFLYKNKKYESSSYSLHNKIDSYLSEPVLVLNYKYNQKELDNYLENNNINSLYFVNSISDFNSRFNLNLTELQAGYLTKENETFIYTQLTLSSTSLISKSN